MPCKTWFFWFCIDSSNIHVRSWYWILPPGIYGPGPPPINIIRLPPGYTMQGNLPDWPRITIGRDNELTTESKSQCETETVKACTYTTYVTAGETKSSTAACETITGCSLRVSDSTTTVIGKQTPAPIGTLAEERWATMTLGDDFTNSVYAAVASREARLEAEGDATTIVLSSGPTPGPTCAAGSTACGGTICSGYWCSVTPTGSPPGFLDPKDPSSSGYTAPTKTIGTSNPPSGQPTTPLERGPINCFKESDFPGHPDLQSGDQDSFSEQFSGIRSGATDLIGPDDAPVHKTYKDKYKTHYDFECKWVPGCKTTQEKMSFQFPLGNIGDVTPYLLVREDFTKCKWVLE